MMPVIEEKMKVMLSQKNKSKHKVKVITFSLYRHAIQK